MADAPTSELGYQSMPLWGWTDFAETTYETNPDLMWPKSLDVFDKMRREDPQVLSVLRACQLPIRSARWSIDPNGAREEVVQLVAGDLGLGVKGGDPVRPLRTRGRFSWAEHLRLALLELVYGHSYFEQVYDTSIEPGRAHLRKLAWRPPRTIAKINVATDGGLVSIEQDLLVGGDSLVVIPVDRLVAYVNEREGGNWLGQSLLRPAYKNWLLKDRELRAQALTIERNGLGIPDYEAAPAPEGADVAKQLEWSRSEIDSGLKVAKNLRAGESAGVSRANGSSLQLLSVMGKLPETDGPIRYHDEQIARAVLAHFLNLGTETGSWALGSTFANFFTNSLNAVAIQLADVTQQHVVEDLVDLNFGPKEPAPRIVVDPIGSEQPSTAEAIAALVSAGIVVSDDPLETYMRDAYGLPPKDSNTSRELPARPDQLNPQGGTA